MIWHSCDVTGNVGTEKIGMIAITKNRELFTGPTYKNLDWSFIPNKAKLDLLMETFSALLAICGRNSPVTGEFLAQRPVTRSFDVFFDLRIE